MSDKISVYGSTGFIGEIFCKMYPDEVLKVPRESREPLSNNILYLISTTSNSNILKDTNIDVRTNLSVLTETLEFCKKKGLIFNYISTGFVYGLDINQAKETDVCDPRGFYSITKRTAEQLLISFCETFEIKYRILRVANVYGHDKTVLPGKNVLGFLIDKMRKNETITLFNNGDDLRDYMHVNDLCRAFKMVIDKGETNSIYNIATGNPRPFREILEIAKEILQSQSEFVSVETPRFNTLVQPKDYTLNVDKLNTLGFRPEIDLEEGLKLLCI